MSNKSNNFMFSERVKLEYILNTNTHGGATKLAKILGKSRSTIYYELRNYITKSVSRAEAFNNQPKDYKCEILKSFPFVCNGCANVRCSHRSVFYNVYEAQFKADKLLHDSRKDKER